MLLRLSAAPQIAIIFALGIGWADGQELEPRAYSVSPRDTNFAVIGYGRSSGDLSIDPTLPIEDAHAQLNSLTLGYVRTLDVFGRSASIGVETPYVWGPSSGSVYGQFASIRRSGISDPSARFAINLYGAPAMDVEQFADYRQKTNIGASVSVVLPLGQYDPNALINIGSNRWAVKPELGVSHRAGRWYFDLYLGAWIFAANDNFFRGHIRTQDPLGSTQFHVSYNITRRIWAAFDATFYTGGRTSLDGVPNADLQRNSRVGGTIAIPLAKGHSLKFSVSTGAVTNIGASFTTIAVAYQRFWGRGL